jgi:hypothetical protein
MNKNFGGACHSICGTKEKAEQQNSLKSEEILHI